MSWQKGLNSALLAEKSGISQLYQQRVLLEMLTGRVKQMRKAASIQPIIQDAIKTLLWTLDVNANKSFGSVKKVQYSTQSICAAYKATDSEMYYKWHKFPAHKSCISAKLIFGCEHMWMVPYSMMNMTQLSLLLGKI